MLEADGYAAFAEPTRRRAEPAAAPDADRRPVRREPSSAWTTGDDDGDWSEDRWAESGAPAPTLPLRRLLRGVRVHDPGRARSPRSRTTTPTGRTSWNMVVIDLSTHDAG